MIADLMAVGLPELPKNAFVETPTNAPLDDLKAFDEMQELVAHWDVGPEGIGRDSLKQLFSATLAWVMESAQEHYNAGFRRGAKWAEQHLRDAISSKLLDAKWAARGRYFWPELRTEQARLAEADTFAVQLEAAKEGRRQALQKADHGWKTESQEAIRRHVREESCKAEKNLQETVRVLRQLHEYYPGEIAAPDESTLVAMAFPSELREESVRA
jgi:hypothetical protein